MKLAVLSDLHLGSDSVYQEFTHTEDAFLRFLDAIEAEHEHILVPGDLYNLDCARVPFRFASELELTQRRYPRLTRRLHTTPYHLVYGNHDAALGKLLGVPESLELELGGARILMVHGHQFDGFARKVPYLGPSATWTTAWLNRLELARLSRWVIRAGTAAAHARPRDRSLPNDERAAGELLTQRGVDLVVMGHTHRAAFRRYPSGGHYVNAGANCFGDLRFASVDLASMEIELRNEAEG